MERDRHRQLTDYHKASEKKQKEMIKLINEKPKPKQMVEVTATATLIKKDKNK